MIDSAAIAWRMTPIWQSPENADLYHGLLVDIEGNGVDLVSADGGVRFDLLNDGVKRKIAWTKAGADDAFVVIEPSGPVFSSKQLLSTAQTLPDGRRLATPDRALLAIQGYNFDAKFGVVNPSTEARLDSNDQVFHTMRLWRDANHDGESQPDELLGFPTAGVRWMSAGFRGVYRIDEAGNSIGPLGTIGFYRDGIEEIKSVVVVGFVFGK